MPPLIDTVTTGLGQVINDKTVAGNSVEWPSLQPTLVLLTPGTVTPPANGFLFPRHLRGQGSFGINTAGQREDTTNWLVNGINLNDPVQNQITFQPPIDNPGGIQDRQFVVSGGNTVEIPAQS